MRGVKFATAKYHLVAISTWEAWSQCSRHCNGTMSEL